MIRRWADSALGEQLAGAIEHLGFGMAHSSVAVGPGGIQQVVQPTLSKAKRRISRPVAVGCDHALNQGTVFRAEHNALQCQVIKPGADSGPPDTLPRQGSFDRRRIPRPKVAANA